MPSPVPSPGLTRLAETLQVDVDRLAHLDRLGDARIDSFATLVTGAQARDAQSIEAGLQETLRFVPRLLRGTAKKLLFPGDAG